MNKKDIKEIVKEIEQERKKRRNELIKGTAVVIGMLLPFCASLAVTDTMLMYEEPIRRATITFIGLTITIYETIIIAMLWE